MHYCEKGSVYFRPRIGFVEVRSLVLISAAVRPVMNCEKNPCPAVVLQLFPIIFALRLAECAA